MEAADYNNSKKNRERIVLQTYLKFHPALNAMEWREYERPDFISADSQYGMEISQLIVEEDAITEKIVNDGVRERPEDINMNYSQYFGHVFSTKSRQHTHWTIGYYSSTWSIMTDEAKGK